jgi:hypothetical protein
MELLEPECCDEFVEDDFERVNEVKSAFYKFIVRQNFGKVPLMMNKTPAN